jgi:hypothetical protein
MEPFNHFVQNHFMGIPLPKGPVIAERKSAEFLALVFCQSSRLRVISTSNLDFPSGFFGYKKRQLTFQ